MNRIDSSDVKNRNSFKSYKWSLLILLACLSTCVYVSNYKSLSESDSEFVIGDSKIQSNKIVKHKPVATRRSEIQSETLYEDVKSFDVNNLSSQARNQNSHVLRDEKDLDQTKVNESIIQSPSTNIVDNLLKTTGDQNQIRKQNIYDTYLTDENENTAENTIGINKSNENSFVSNGPKANYSTNVIQQNSVFDDQILNIETLPVQSCCDLLFSKMTALDKEPNPEFSIVRLPDHSAASVYAIKVEQGVGTWKNSVFYFNQDNTELNYSKQVNLNSYLGVTRNIGRKWTIETGLKYNRLKGNISFYEERDTIIQLEYVSKKRINSLTGEVLDEVTTTKNVTALQWTRIKYTNTLNLLSVPIKINRIFPLTKNIKANIGLGVDYGLVLAGSGKWLSNQAEVDDQQNVILDMNSQLFNRHVFSTSSTLGLQYGLLQNIDIHFNIQYSNFISDISKSNRLELKPNSVFASIGFSYRL